jgi:hypothetical protein
MMMLAANRCATASGTQVELVEGDMREFELGRRFSLIFVARNSVFPQELLALLAVNGVRLTRRDGDFIGGSFTSTSASQVCQCRLA